MGFLDLLFLSLALAMDCFTISIVCGVILKEKDWKTILKLSFFFGLFQAMMPLIGWLFTTWFADYIRAVDHWIAFGLLAFIGAKMIKEAFSEEEHQCFDPQKFSTQILLAVATSIDALAVGISFACTGYDSFGQMTLPLVMIGITSFLAGIIGSNLGLKFGFSVAKRFKPELFGGIILICIGLKILAEHLL
ncbi:MAG: manganese efflux pump MntP family protein [Bacteroidales bacterium]|nr:manganese efflux pump MntP family protein [Bacteroidales bacterium]